jgi:hypothetical protein
MEEMDKVIPYCKFSTFCVHKNIEKNNLYRMPAIVSRGLYIFYHTFENHFFVFKEVFPENSVLKYG